MKCSNEICRFLHINEGSTYQKVTNYSLPIYTILKPDGYLLTIKVDPSSEVILKVTVPVVGPFISEFILIETLSEYDPITTPCPHDLSTCVQVSLILIGAMKIN